MCSSSRLLVLLLSLCAVAAVPHREGKHLMLSKEDVLHASLVDLLLSDLLQTENEVVEDESFAGGMDPADVHVALERSAGGGALLAPRERKAGCKNFFWKTFTSC